MNVIRSLFRKFCRKSPRVSRISKPKIDSNSSSLFRQIAQMNYLAKIEEYIRQIRLKEYTNMVQTCSDSEQVIEAHNYIDQLTNRSYKIHKYETISLDEYMDQLYESVSYSNSNSSWSDYDRSDTENNESYAYESESDSGQESFVSVLSYDSE